MAAQPVIGLELGRDSAPTSTPLTHSDERIVYRVKVKNDANANPNVGDQLTCENSLSNWFFVPGEADFAFKWLRNGEEISGATAKTYTTTAADEGQAIQCEVIGTNPSTGVTTVNARATASAGSNTLTSVNVKFGSFAVGQEVSGFGIPTGATIIAIGPGTLELSVAATDSAPGVTLLGLAPSRVSTSSVSISLPPVVVNPLPTTLPPAPVDDPKQVESRPQVASVPGGFGSYYFEGEKLSCEAPTNWTPGATFTYRWMRNGEEIPGATNSEYTPVDGEDKTSVLQCAVIAQSGSGVQPGGGKTVSNSSNVRLTVKNDSDAESFSVVQDVPNDGRGGREGRPTIGFANTLTEATVEVELPGGQETYALKLREPGVPSPWNCAKTPPTPQQHARVDCVRDDSLAPGESYDHPLEIITHIGRDAPDTLVAKATVSGPDADPVSDEDQVTLLPAVPFGFKAFSTKVADDEGDDFTKAGGHPFSAGASLAFNDHVPTLPTNAGLRVTNGFVRQVVTKLPKGFTGNPQAVPETCPEVGMIPKQACPPGSIVGGITLETEFNTFPGLPVYAVEPERGEVATFGFGLRSPEVAYVLTPELHAKDGYAISVVSAPAPKSPELLGASVTLCGFGVKVQGSGFNRCKKPTESGSFKTPFLTNPTDCRETPKTVIQADSWEHPGEYAEAESLNPPLTGCDEVEFEPEVELAPTSKQADSPTGLDVEVSMDQEGLLSKKGTAQASIESSTITLPKGMALNPTAAEGLDACTSAQIGIGNDDPVSCPQASKVGTLEVETPLLEEALPGSLYVAKQGDNPFGSLLGLYLVIDSPRYGILIKLAGKVTVDPTDGQLTTSFQDIPQAPVSKLTLHLNSGERAPLLTPPKCGSYAIHSVFTPWSESAPLVEDTRFKVSKGPNGGACPTGSLEGVVTGRLANPTAGATSPFELRLRREDGTQRLSSLELTMPPGLTGYLKGIPYCPDAALASISTAEGTGAKELASPSCPAASQIGSLSVGAGAGANPFYVNTAKAYLAGPYKGAPLSIAVVAPAVAGPFDLGSVVVRNAAYLNPETAVITLKADPLPTILHGIPLDLRDIRVNVDRPHFILAPTSCEAKSLDALLGGVQGQSQSLSDRFQVGGCERLGFKPKLALKLSGKTNRGAFPALRATYAARSGDANLKGLVLRFPKSEFIEQGHFRTICTRVQWAAGSGNGTQCPPRSVYGHVRAFTPLLDQPLEGPVYLRSSSHQLPDVVFALRGQVNAEVAVRVDSAKGGLRTTVTEAPDVPVSKVVISMQGGQKGLFVNSRDLCSHTFRADAQFTAQNNAAADLRPAMGIRCAKGKRGGRRG
ncbi:MAG TPA: hypothetical protein VG816_14070 [Solirubrobacterales bacterium]|nr:hypothetical protein [Solirubrobacterales bacterium]